MLTSDKNLGTTVKLKWPFSAIGHSRFFVNSMVVELVWDLVKVCSTDLSIASSIDMSLVREIELDLPNE